MDRPSKALLERLHKWQESNSKDITRYLLVKMLLREIDAARREGFEAARMTNPVAPRGRVNRFWKYGTYEDYLRGLEEEQK